MESATVTPTAQEIADLVVQRLIEGGGIQDLASANLLTIEEQTIEEVDRVTRLVMSELLTQPSNAATVRRRGEPRTATNDFMSSLTRWSFCRHGSCGTCRCNT